LDCYSLRGGAMGGVIANAFAGGTRLDGWHSTQICSVN
jgi:hypothetical protein